jgi:hypothetical protein
MNLAEAHAKAFGQQLLGSIFVEQELPRRCSLRYYGEYE